MPGRQEAAPITTVGTIGAFAGIFAAVAAGRWLAAKFSGGAITIPGFLWCMIVGVAIRNVAPFAGLRFDDRASDLISGVCLSLFLVMTMMALNLVEVALSAGPFLVIIAAQAVAIAAYVIFVCFRFMGRDYEAAVTSAAFIGFNMGSTATAMANMQAIVNKYGPAPTELSDRPSRRRVLHRPHERVRADAHAGSALHRRMSMRALVSMLLAVPLLALAGCGGGPDVEALRKDVSGRLAQALPEGTVALAAFDRRGSQADSKAPAGETRRTVYFDVELKLERAFDFGAWDSPGVAGIVSALGAGPKGITGITSGGNKAGDVLRAHGTALYRKDGEQLGARRRRRLPAHRGAGLCHECAAGRRGHTRGNAQGGRLRSRRTRRPPAAQS